MPIHKVLKHVFQSRAGNNGQILNPTFDVSDTNLN